MSTDAADTVEVNKGITRRRCKVQSCGLYERLKKLANCSLTVGNLQRVTPDSNGLQSVRERIRLLQIRASPTNSFDLILGALAGFGRFFVHDRGNFCDNCEIHVATRHSGDSA